MKIILLFFLLIGFCHCNAQTSFDDIDYNLINYKTVRNFIHDEIANHASKITDIHPSCTSDTDLSTFENQKKNYLIKDNLTRVWSNYINTSPAKSWEGKLVSFGVLFSKPLDKIVYSGDDFQAIEPGQVIFLNLRLLRGIYHLAMGFEIINVDSENKIIEFSYIEGNKSQGIQRLEFFPTKDGYTEIVHSSFYKSQSKLRDKFLYPLFHKQATNEFHRNFRKRVKYMSLNTTRSNLVIKEKAQ